MLGALVFDYNWRNNRFRRVMQLYLTKVVQLMESLANFVNLKILYMRNPPKSHQNI